MSIISDLRQALTDSKNAKDKSREAGAGIWGNYVRAVCSVGGVDPFVHGDVAKFDVQHDTVVSSLDSIYPLTKEDKNSLRSAKCVIRKLVETHQEHVILETDEASQYIRDNNGMLVPRGKSELQGTKSDREKLDKAIDTLSKLLDKDELDVTSADMAGFAKLIQGMSVRAWTVGASIAGADPAEFMSINNV